MGIYKKLWDRSKDGENHARRSSARFYLGATFLFLVAISISSDNIFRLVGTRITILRQNARIREIQKDIDEVRQNVSTLQTNRDSLEKYSRERFNFCAPGEDVYLLSK